MFFKKKTVVYIAFDFDVHGTKFVFKVLSGLPDNLMPCCGVIGRVPYENHECFKKIEKLIKSICSNYKCKFDWHRHLSMTNLDLK